MHRLDGKTALITGGTSGIGLATARLFIDHGARVIVTGRDRAALSRTGSQLGARCTTIRADVTSAEEMRAAAEHIASSAGELDIFVASAGIAYATPLGETDEARYDQLMDVNVKGVF
ncbi:MAG: SDR family NAD(P)-dependent oxidoreductase, partial [Mycobacterium sp.]